MTERSPEALQKLGGIQGLYQKLHTSPHGLDQSTLQEDLRVERYGKNELIKPEPKPFLQLWLEAFNDTTLIILMVLAVISLIIAFAVEKGEDLSWLDGTAILATVVVVTFVTAWNTWSQERQFQKLNERTSDRTVLVTRHGIPTPISLFSIVVGDILTVSTGDVLPVDGLCIEANNIQCDEAAMTGEADLIRKSPDKNPYLLSGCKVQTGFGKMLVVCVGMKTQFGILKEAVLSAAKEREQTPLQEKLDTLAQNIGYVGMVAAGFVLLILLIFWFVIGIKDTSRFKDGDFWMTLVEYFTIAVTIIVMAVPEGLPLAVTIALAYSMSKMLDDNNLVRMLAACETMGGATTICSDKTGTLTQNKMKVTAAFFDGKLIEPITPQPNIQHITSEALANQANENLQDAPPDDRNALLDLAGKNTLQLPAEYFNTVMDSISLNSSADLRANHEATGGYEYLGNVTECAMLLFLLEQGVRYTSVRQAHHTLQVFPFSSDLKRMSVVVEGKTPDSYRLYTKGASEIVSGMCTQMHSGGTIKAITESDRKMIDETINTLASKGLRTIALAYKDISHSEAQAHKRKTEEEDQAAEAKKKKEDDEAVQIHPLTPDSPFSSSYHSSASSTPGQAPKSARISDKDTELMDIALQNAQNLSATTSSSTEAMLEMSHGHDGQTMINLDATSQSVSQPPSSSSSSSSSNGGFVDADDTSQPLGSRAPEDNLILIGITGIKDPLRPEVTYAISDCHDAAIVVRMVTGDNIITAMHIAEECGIYNPSDDIAMEGPLFRQLSDEDRKRILPRLRVLARSSPIDKHTLVCGLQDLGHVVAVTGDGTNDAPALSKSDVGFAMGITGTEVAKDASDIIITDDNFASIVKAVMWGRNVYDSIRKFIQFQLTVNISAIMIAVIGAIFAITPLRAVQMLWVNLIMDTLAALALATETPTKLLLKRKPYGRTDSIICKSMWRNIICGALYESIILVICLFLWGSKVPFKDPDDIKKGCALLQDKDEIECSELMFPNGLCRSFLLDKKVPVFSEQHFSFIFNTYIYMQVFNWIPSRKCYNEINFLDRILENYMFLIILLLVAALQVVIMLVPGIRDAFTIIPISGKLWGISFAFSVFIIPYRFLVHLWKMPDPFNGEITSEPDSGAPAGVYRLGMDLPQGCTLTVPGTATPGTPEPTAQTSAVQSTEQTDVTETDALDS